MFRKRKMIISLLLFTLAGTFTSCIAQNPNDAEQACLNLLDKLIDIKSQPDSSPYTVSANSLGNNKISVKISSSNGETFEGFVLQARSASNREKFTPGEFSIDSTSKGEKCGEYEKSTLTNATYEPKPEVSTEWTGSLDENIIFRAAVRKDSTATWIKIDSDPVEKKEQDSENPIDNPQNCIDIGTCKVILEFHDMGFETIEFTLTGLLEESQYMAMGISEDNRMGDDFVTACLRGSSEKISLQKSWNEGRNNKLAEDVTDTASTAKIEREKTVCSWTEKKDVSFHDKKYDLTKKPYILLAQGQVEKGNLKQHELMLASSEPVDLFANGTLSLEKQGGDTKPSGGKPGEKNGENTGGEPGGEPSEKPGKKTGGKPGEKEEGETGGEPGGKGSGKTGGNKDGEPGGEPGGKGSGKTGGNKDGEPGGEIGGEKDGELVGHQTTETSSKIKSTVQVNSSSQLKFGLFWLAFLGVFYASGRNFLNLI